MEPEPLGYGPWHVLNRDAQTLAHFREEGDARTWAAYYLAQHPDECVLIACDREYWQKNEHARRERPQVPDGFWTTERLLTLAAMEVAAAPAGGLPERSCPQCPEGECRVGEDGNTCVVCGFVPRPLRGGD